MRKKSTRLLSAALAACMMLSALPVGAFAAEPGTEPENAATAQEEEQEIHLNGGETITDKKIAEDNSNGFYTLSGKYKKTITITATQPVTLNLRGNVESEVSRETLLNVLGTGTVTINGNGFTFQVAYCGEKHASFLEVDNAGADVTVNGGKYYHPYSSDRSRAIFWIKKGTAHLNGVECVSDTDDLRTMILNAGTLYVDGGKFDNKYQIVLINGYDYSDEGEHYGGIATIQNVNIEDGAIYSEHSTLNLIDSSINCNYHEYRYLRAIYIDSGELNMKNVKASVSGGYGDGNVIAFGWASKDTKIRIEDSTISARNGQSAGIYTGNVKDFDLEIDNTTFEDCNVGIKATYYPTVTLKDVRFRNSRNSQWCDLYLDPDVQIAIEKTFTDKALIVANGACDGRQITTKTATNYQKDLKLISKSKDYFIAYQKDDDGEFRYLKKRETSKSFYVNAINATASTGDGTVLEPYAQLTEGTTPVKLTADIPENARVTGWKVEKIAADGVTEMPGVVAYDPENPETATMTMPDYDVFVTAVYEDVIDDPGADAADNIKGALSAVVVGAAAGAIIYEAGTGIYRVINMPGIPMPSNRIELAELLWEHAGKPEPVSTALYSDIDEDDTDAQKAAHWAVEQDLMQDNSEKNTFNPHFPVSKLRTCLTWNAAKEKGLFDTNKTAE